MRPPSKDRLPNARPGIYRWAVLPVTFEQFKVIEPILPELQAALDFARLRPDFSPSHWKTVDTLHVTTAPLENVLSHGYGKHVITLQDAFDALRRKQKRDKANETSSKR